MKVTSALVNKKIKMLEEQTARILELEASSCVYIRADGEVESLPVYDYTKTQQEVMEINNKIRKIKHAVNIFNTTTYLEEIGLYIDEALVEVTLLSKRKSPLYRAEICKKIPEKLRLLEDIGYMLRQNPFMSKKLDKFFCENRETKFVEQQALAKEAYNV